MCVIRTQAPGAYRPLQMIHDVGLLLSPEEGMASAVFTACAVPWSGSSPSIVTLNSGHSWPAYHSVTRRKLACVSWPAPDGRIGGSLFHEGAQRRAVIGCSDGISACFPGIAAGEAGFALFLVDVVAVYGALNLLIELGRAPGRGGVGHGVFGVRLSTLAVLRHDRYAAAPAWCARSLSVDCPTRRRLGGNAANTRRRNASGRLGRSSAFRRYSSTS